jgi:hypothetical protein
VNFGFRYYNLWYFCIYWQFLTHFQILLMILFHLAAEKDKISKIIKIFKNFPIQSFRVGVKKKKGQSGDSKHTYFCLTWLPVITFNMAVTGVQYLVRQLQRFSRNDDRTGVESSFSSKGGGGGHKAKGLVVLTRPWLECRGQHLWELSDFHVFTDYAKNCTQNWFKKNIMKDMLSIHIFCDWHL